MHQNKIPWCQFLSCKWNALSTLQRTILLDACGIHWKYKRLGTRFSWKFTCPMHWSIQLFIQIPIGTRQDTSHEGSLYSSNATIVCLAHFLTMRHTKDRGAITMEYQEIRQRGYYTELPLPVSPTVVSTTIAPLSGKTFLQGNALAYTTTALFDAGDSPRCHWFSIGHETMEKWDVPGYLYCYDHILTKLKGGNQK